MQVRKRFRTLLPLSAMLLAGLVVQQTANASHPRPIGASPLRVSLVPSYKFCGSPNGSHPKLTHSCVPPVKSSNYLTVGTPDANGNPSQSSGTAKLTVEPGEPAIPNDADVLIDIDITDVRNVGDLSDYTGELMAATDIRLTDHRSGPSGGLGGNSAGTASDIVLGPVIISCVATADPTVGGTCGAFTSWNAIYPSGGIVAELKRTIVQKRGNLRIEDGGADGIWGTTPNTEFMTEGLFIP